MFDELRKNILRVLFECSKRSNQKAYVVGGFPRDILLGKYSFQDIDVVVFGDYKEFARMISSQLEGSSLVDIQKYKTGRIYYKGIVIDVSTSKGPDIFSDLMRRDFTVNTLVIPLEDLLDPVNHVMDPLGKGKEDLKLLLLRTPSHPAKAIKDDPVRIVRAARLISENFIPEEALLEESKKRVGSLTSVPRERIGEELRKLFLAKKPSAGLFFLRDIGFFEAVFPRLSPALYKEQRSPHHFEGVFEHCVRVVDLTPPNIVMRLAAFFHDIGKAYVEKVLPDGRYVYWGHEFISADICQDFLSTFRFPESEKEKVVFIVKKHMIYYSDSWSDAAVRRLIKRLYPYLDEVFEFVSYDVRALKNPSQAIRALEELRERVRREILKLGRADIKSPLNGHEIQRLFGLKEGRIIGEIKSAIENAIIEGKIKATKDEAINFVRRLIPKLKVDSESTKVDSESTIVDSESTIKDPT